MAVKQCIPELGDVYRSLEVLEAWCASQGTDMPEGQSDVELLAIAIGMDLIACRFLMSVEGRPC